MATTLPTGSLAPGQTEQVGSKAAVNKAVSSVVANATPLNL